MPRVQKPPKPLKLTPRVRRLLTAAEKIREVEAKDIDYLHSVQCQTSLPYRDPGPDVRIWEHEQGAASLSIEAGRVRDPVENVWKPVGLPYGEKPRLILIHLASEAVKNNSSTVEVEHSMTAFARSVGLDVNGPSLRTLKDQLLRLSVATIRLGFRTGERRALQVNSNFVKAFDLDLWYPRDDRQGVLWDSKVRLSDEFFESLKEHAVPLDYRAIGALSQSSMALDVYVWLAQRLHRVEPGRPQFIGWESVFRQFGQGFKRLRDFRSFFLEVLGQVLCVYPAARVEANETGLTLYESPPPIAKRVHPVGLTPPT